jgi:hypothetical protein
LFRYSAQQFRLFDRYGADQHRLAAIMRFLDRLGDRRKFVCGVLVEFVILVDPLHVNIGRDFDDVQFVDVEKFLRFGGGSAGHPRNLWVHAEIILEGDRRQRLVFRLDLATPSLASTAWCKPFDQRRPSIIRPVNSSMMITSPFLTI